VVIDARILDVNPAAEAMSGLPRESLVGCYVRERFPEFADRWLTAATTVMETGEPVAFEHSIGAVGRSIRASFFRMDANHLGSVFEDVTDRVEAERRNWEEREILQTIINNSPIGISMRDRYGRLLTYNEAWKRIWGLTDTDIARFTKDRKALRFDDRDDYLGEFQSGVRRVYTEGGSFVIPELQLQIPKPGKAEWVAQFFYSLADSTGTVDKVVILTEDISRRKKADLASWRYTMQLEILNEIEQSVLEAGSLREMLATSLEILRRTVEYTYGFALAIHHDHAPESVIEPGFPRKAEHFPADYLPYIDPDKQKIALIPDLEQKPLECPFEEDIWRAGCRSYLLIPLVLDGHTRIMFGCAAITHGVLSPEDTHLYWEIAVVLSMAARQVLLRENLKREAETNTLLLKEVNHRVKNNLTAILGLLLTERTFAQQRDASADEVLQEITGHIRNMASVHAMLSIADWEMQTVDQLLDRVVQSSLRANAPGKPFQVRIKPIPYRIISLHSQRLALAVHEIVSNSVKNNTESRIEITVEYQSEPDWLHILICDNGPGFPQDVIDGTRHQVGLYLLHNIVCSELKGRYTLKNKKGAVVEIILPATLFNAVEDTP
jgi:PAS domain S-box-containing protein